MILLEAFLEDVFNVNELSLKCVCVLVFATYWVPISAFCILLAKWEHFGCSSQLQTTVLGVRPGFKGGVRTGSWRFIGMLWVRTRECWIISLLFLLVLEGFFLCNSLIFKWCYLLTPPPIPPSPCQQQQPCSPVLPDHRPSNRPTVRVRYELAAHLPTQDAQRRAWPHWWEFNSLPSVATMH